MKKLLSALLACSLSFLLLGFKGCCKQNTAACAPKKMSKKTPAQTKSTPSAKVAYNHEGDFLNEEGFDQFAYFDKNKLIEDFDTDVNAANNALDALSADEQNALHAEIDQLVQLWSSDDNRDLSVDFKTLYLDSAPAAIETEETKSPLVVASSKLPSEEESNALLTALDEAKEIARDIEAETKDIRPEELSA